MIDTNIYSYTRTPIGAFKGSLSSINATKLGSIVIEDVIFKYLDIFLKTSSVCVANSLVGDNTNI